MPSAISHAVVALAAGASFAPQNPPGKLFTLSVICSVMPDVDVLGFAFGIPYGHFFGHKGFFHSLSFAFLMSLLVVTLFFREATPFSSGWWYYLLYFFSLSASHGLLDAFTDGGLGVALLSPFDNTRYFFPWRPLVVSPIGLEGFFSRWGRLVIKSELLWIWIPSGLLILFVRGIRWLL